MPESSGSFPTQPIIIRQNPNNEAIAFEAQIEASPESEIPPQKHAQPFRWLGDKIMDFTVDKLLPPAVTREARRIAKRIERNKKS